MPRLYGAACGLSKEALMRILNESRAAAFAKEHQKASHSLFRLRDHAGKG
jgi:hypothetical protein